MLKAVFSGQCRKDYKLPVKRRWGIKSQQQFNSSVLNRVSIAEQ